MPVGIKDGNWKSLFSRHLPKPNRVHVNHDENITPAQGLIDLRSFLPSTQTFIFLSRQNNRTRSPQQNIFSVIKVIRKSSAQTRGVVFADPNPNSLVVVMVQKKRNSSWLTNSSHLTRQDTGLSRNTHLEKISSLVFDRLQYVRDWLEEAGFRRGLESDPVGKEGQGWFIEARLSQPNKDSKLFGSEATNCLLLF